MFNYRNHRFLLLILFTVATLATITSSVHALSLGGKDLDPSQLKTMPRWPFYCAIIGAITAIAFHLSAYLRDRKPKSKVFPKLELRRRLYAPYSGGNHANISFGSHQ